MLNRARIFQLAALLLIAGFVFGLVRLLALRYATGDVFPAYSSLRADPLGVKIFYESLRALPGREISRNERDLDHINAAPETALFVIGVRDAALSLQERHAVEEFVQAGGRLVITFFPKYAAVEKATPTPSPSPGASPSPTPSPESTPKGILLTKLLAEWEVKLKTDRDSEDSFARLNGPLSMEETLSWHSGLSFQPQHPDWRTIYECDRGPVIIERQFGAGSLVLASDSYVLSNEALLAERAPEFLAWLSANRARFIFDETHLNIHEQPGVMTLLRRYGLGGFIIGFLVLLAFWMWRNATWSLVSRTATERDDAVTGRGSHAGFVNLLRRGIAPVQLLEVCLGEWKRSSSTQQKARAGEIETLAAAHAENPVVAYNRIHDLLQTRKWKTKPTA